MEDNSNAGRWSIKYAILKYMVNVSFRVFYRSLHVSGQDNVPEGGGVIFAANHQNALMDALAVLLTSKYQPVYLARADIFRNPVIAGILGFLKIMPVYRFRDGVEVMGKNHDTFDKTRTVLGSGGCIGIMPEGNHDHRKRLRTLKKGIFRIAFSAMEGRSKRAGIKIIPVGLNYRNTSEFFGELIVNYGEPLCVNDYMDSYTQHNQKGINRMKKDLAGSLSALMIDVRDEKQYEKDKLIIDIGSSLLTEGGGSKISDPHGKFLINKALCQALYEYFEKHPCKANELRSKSSGFLELIASRGISPEAVNEPLKGPVYFLSLKRALIFPVFMTGFLLHLFPVLIIHHALKKIKDPQFISSFKFVLGTLLVPLNYILLAIPAFLLMAFPYAVLMTALLPVSGFLGYICYGFSEKLKAGIHFRRLCMQDKEFEAGVLGLKAAITTDLLPVLSDAGERLR
jgi:1-acyl-sn-glycerol-3-phosphate acyltransferase